MKRKILLLVSLLTLISYSNIFGQQVFFDSGDYEVCPDEIMYYQIKFEYYNSTIKQYVTTYPSMNNAW